MNTIIPSILTISSSSESYAILFLAKSCFSFTFHRQLSFLTAFLC